MGPVSGMQVISCLSIANACRLTVHVLQIVKFYCFAASGWGSVGCCVPSEYASKLPRVLAVYPLETSWRPVSKVSGAFCLPERTPNHISVVVLLHAPFARSFMIPPCFGRMAIQSRILLPKTFPAAISCCFDARLCIDPRMDLLGCSLAPLQTSIFMLAFHRRTHLNDEELPQSTLGPTDRKMLANLPLHPEMLDCTLSFLYKGGHADNLQFLDSLPMQFRLVTNRPLVNMQQVRLGCHTDPPHCQHCSAPTPSASALH